MPEFTQFKEDHPIVRDVPISSAAKGDEKVAEIFGAAGKALVTEAVALKKEQKDAMILHDSNRIIEVTNQAKMDIALHPEMAADIQKKTQETTTTLLNGVPAEYREKVRSTYDTHLGSVGVEAAKTIYRQNKLRTQRALYQELPIQFENLKKITEPDKFEKDFALVHQTLEAGVLSGAISGQYYAHAMKTLNGIADRNQGYHDMLQRGATAHQYSHADNYKFTNDHTGAGARPSQEDHEVLQNHYSQEQTYQAALADASVGIVPKQETIAKLTDKEFDTVRYHLDGALNAQAGWDVGHPYQLKVDRVAELKSAPYLTQEQQGELKYDESVINGLKNGQFKQIYANTNHGARDFETWNDNRAAIQAVQFNGNSIEEAEANKQQALLQNDVDYKRRQIAGADAMGIPRNLVNVVPDQEMAPIKNAFTRGADVMPALNAIYSQPPDMAYFATIPLKDPMQKAAVWGVSLRRATMPDNQPADIYSVRLMRAAQGTRDDKILELGKDNSTSEATIRLSIESNLKSATNFMRNVPEGFDNTAPEWIKGTTQLGVNYVKDRMIETGDYKGDHMKDYAQEFADGQNANYKIYSNMNGSLNLNEVKLTTAQADDLINYELIQHREESQKLVGNARAMAAEDLAHVNVTNTRDGQIVVVAPDGTVLSHTVITPKLIDAATHTAIQTRNQIHAERDIQMSPFSFTQSNKTIPEKELKLPPLGGQVDFPGLGG